MANARVALSSVLGTVTDTANAFSSVVQTGADGIDMLHNFVKHKKREQSLFYAADDANMIARVEEKAAMEMSERRKEISKWIKSDPENAEIFESSIAQVRASMAKFLNANEA